MKLHLPKLLCAAVMVAMSSVAQNAYAAAPSAGDVLTAEDIVDSRLDVGDAPASTSSKNPLKVIYQGDLEVTDGIQVGTFSGEDRDVLVKKFNGTGSSPHSNSLEVTGSLKISGSGQVILGGQTHSNSYMGLYASNVTVDGTRTSKSDPNLQACMAYIDNLTIKGGTVVLRTNDDYATGGFDGFENGDGSKQTMIKKSLTVSDGSLYIGKSNGQNGTAYAKHFLTAIGARNSAATITQTGGYISITGKTKVWAGLVLNQSGGEMVFANDTSGRAMVVFEGSAANKINQSGDSSTKLTIGEMSVASWAYVNGAFTTNGAGKAVVDITQTGTGTINLEKGVKYTSNVASTIKQSGGGTINLSGDFTSADFTVTQTKGTINQKGKMDLVGTNDVGGTLVNSGTLTIADVNVIGTLVNDGTMTISGKATISGKFVNNTNSLTATTINLVEGGVFENNGTWAMSGGDLNAGTIAGTGTYVYQSALKLTEGTLQLTLNDVSDSSPSTFGGTLLDVNSYTLDVASDVTIALAMSGEVETLFRSMLANQADTPVEFTMLVAEDVSNWQNLNTAALAAQTEHSAYISGVSYSARDGKVYVSGKLIPEPTTATLSLMALAALAARRRRK